jgi:hypothetical protein
VVVLVVLAAAACGSSGGAGGSSSSPTAPTPAAPGTFRIAVSGAETGDFVNTAPTGCDTTSGLSLKMQGTLNGAPAVLSFSFSTPPGEYPITQSGITVDFNRSDARRDYRNQTTDSGTGTVGYKADGTGDIDVTLPEIDYSTADLVPGKPPVVLKGNWACPPGTTMSPAPAAS